MDLNFTKPVSFSMMSKPSGANCNLSCTYCYYLEKRKLYPVSKHQVMNDKVLEKFIHDYIEAVQVPVVNFVWQGGEPALAGIDFYKRVLDFQVKFSGGKKIENSFQTNGTFLNDEWCTFFKENNFLIGISIDGPESIHDYYRKFRDGKPSFARVMKGIELLHKYGVEFNTLTTVQRYNSKFPLDIYHFLKKTGSGFIQFLPVAELKQSKNDKKELKLTYPGSGAESKVTTWSVVPEDYGKFLIEVFDEWVRNDVGKYYVQLFDVTLANWAGEPHGLCVFSETCGNALAVEHNGDVYSCDHFVYPEFMIGNLMENSVLEIIQNPIQNSFGLDKISRLPDCCLECSYRFACHGECPKHRFPYSGTYESGQNYLCKAYKMFFKHVHPYMQFMADELAQKRPPAGVMGWIRRTENKRGSNYLNLLKNTERNDPCPCGSGMKYKNCCLNKKF